MFLCTLATIFVCCSMVFWDRVSVLISHFSRTHSVSRSPSKLHWNLFERFFPYVHLAFTCAPASVHLTRKNAYAVVEIEDRNGSLTLTQTAFFPPLMNYLANCSCWHYWSLSIGGGMIMLYSELFQEREAVWVSRRRAVLFPLFIYHWTDYHTHTRPVILRKIKYLYKNQYFYKNIIPLSIEYWTCFF